MHFITPTYAGDSLSRAQKNGMHGFSIVFIKNGDADLANPLPTNKPQRIG